MKRIYLIAMAAVMICSSVVFSACGNTNTSEPANKTDSSSISTADSAEEIEETEAPTDTTEPTTVAETTKPTGKEKKNSASSSSNTSSQSSVPRTNQSYNGGSTANNSSNTNSRTSNSASRTQNRSVNSKVSVTGISLSKSSMTLTEGSSGSFNVNISPSNATDKQYNVVTNNGNATVSCSGTKVTVYAQHKGTCKITVSSTNGKTSVCNVTVNAKSGSGGSNSNGNGSNNRSSSGSSQKQSSSTNNKSSSGSNNSNSSQKQSSSTNNTPVNDNTLLTHKQLCSDNVLKKLIDKVNYTFQQKGMKYNSALNKNNSGWLYSGTHLYPGDYYYSTNSFIKKELDGLLEEVDAVLIKLDGNDYSDYLFRYYYEKQSNGEYAFYFCYG